MLVFSHQKNLNLCQHCSASTPGNTTFLLNLKKKFLQTGSSMDTEQILRWSKSSSGLDLFQHRVTATQKRGGGMFSSSWKESKQQKTCTSRRLGLLFVRHSLLSSMHILGINIHIQVLKQRENSGNWSTWVCFFFPATSHGRVKWGEKPQTTHHLPK